MHSPVRQRFTAAHEIAHFIYHRDRLERGGGTSDNLAYRTDEKVNDNPHITWLQEHQANQYASNLLIPPHHLQAALAEGLDEARLAERFNVSRAAMRIKTGASPGRAPVPQAPKQEG
jgi:Zn-dependent peptidase ImmA (M78 family)